ncbi:putative riboflavin synthase [Cocos nucifera]|uniref:Putative riboflavin synthase n=1 Tax=Cocos nucifera TaxID=13894 RepID=A0A8K0I9S9_COCNU|nr:putative riboflavin synthase [Cocos nucifera]
MRIAAKTVLGGVHLGDTIAVNGTSLTVSDFDLAASNLTVGVSPETLRRTNLGNLIPSSPVHLERSFQPTSRMGGHFVEVHVEGTGAGVRWGLPLGEGMGAAGAALARGAQGFIEVDGTSLTVVSVYAEEKCFDFMLVGYTQQKIMIPLQSGG